MQQKGHKLVAREDTCYGRGIVGSVQRHGVANTAAVVVVIVVIVAPAAAVIMVLRGLKDKHVLETMLSWWSVRYGRLGYRRRARRARSVSFKKYVDFITYDREYLLTMHVSRLAAAVAVTCMCNKG